MLPAEIPGSWHAQASIIIRVYTPLPPPLYTLPHEGHREGPRQQAWGPAFEAEKLHCRCNHSILFCYHITLILVMDRRQRLVL